MPRDEWARDRARQRGRDVMRSVVDGAKKYAKRPKKTKRTGFKCAPRATGRVLAKCFVCLYERKVSSSAWATEDWTKKPRCQCGEPLYAADQTSMVSYAGFTPMRVYYDATRPEIAADPALG